MENIEVNLGDYGAATVARLSDKREVDAEKLLSDFLAEKVESTSGEPEEETSY